MLINADIEPDDRNPHSWLPLLGDPAGATGPRILYGVLRPCYRERRNSAAEFARSKINVKPVEGGDPWQLTAARAEILLPHGADDRLAEPRVLMEAVDVERPADKPVLLTYVTITFYTERLHHQYELVRAWAKEVLVDELGTGVLLVQHAPHRAASTQKPHVHLLVTRRIGPLGLASYVAPLCGDHGRKLIVDTFMPRFALHNAVRTMPAPAPPSGDETA